MVLIEIPLRSDIASYDFSIDLDSGTYFFELKYNRRKLRWSMNIYDVDKVPVLFGIPLLTDVDTTGQYVSESLFPGMLFMFDKQGEQANPEREGLGDRFILLYNEVT